MYKKILYPLVPLAASAAMLSSCVTISSGVTCSGPARQVTIHYGDSEIRVSPPLIKLKRQEELRFRLRPDSKASDTVDYNTVLVTIKGKDTDEDGNETTENNWIDLSGTYDDSGGYLGVCISSSQAKKTYRYYVDVNTVGKIDPRADVQ